MKEHAETRVHPLLSIRIRASLYAGTIKFSVRVPRQIAKTYARPTGNEEVFRANTSTDYRDGQHRNHPG